MLSSDANPVAWSRHPAGHEHSDQVWNSPLSLAVFVAVDGMLCFSSGRGGGVGGGPQTLPQGGADAALRGSPEKPPGGSQKEWGGSEDDYTVVWNRHPAGHEHSDQVWESPPSLALVQMKPDEAR